MPRLLRLPDYAGERNRGIRRSVDSAGGRDVRAGGERNRVHQHGVWRGLDRRARDDRLVRTGTQPDAGRHLVSGGIGIAVRHRRCRPRRARVGQHRARAERLLLRRQGRGPRLLSQPGAGAGVGAGDVRPHPAGFRTSRPLSQPGGRDGRRLYRADDGADRDRGEGNPRHRQALGGEGNSGNTKQPDLFHLPGAGRTGEAHPQAGSEVRGGPEAGAALRDLHGGRRGNPAGRLRDRLARAALGD